MWLNGPDQNSWQRTQCLPILLLLKLKFKAGLHGRGSTAMPPKDGLASFTQEDNPGCYQTSSSKRGWRAEQPPTGELQCDVVTRVRAFLE